MISVNQTKYFFLGLAGIALLTFIKVSYGTPLSFSLSHCLIPLLGVTFGVPGSFLFFAGKTIIRALRASSLSGFLSLCSLPTFCASLYLSALNPFNGTIELRKKCLLSGLIILCMILFISQTASTQACLYSTFWIIPLLTLWINHRSMFTHMLGSTFTAHAVGSVLWIFFGPSLTPQAWIALMPLVIAERLIFACGMFITYQMLAGFRTQAHVLPQHV